MSGKVFLAKGGDLGIFAFGGFFEQGGDVLVVGHDQIDIEVVDHPVGAGPFAKGNFFRFRCADALPGGQGLEFGLGGNLVGQDQVSVLPAFRVDQIGENAARDPFLLHLALDGPFEEKPIVNAEVRDIRCWVVPLKSGRPGFVF
jgi:hypothetical protein